MVAVAEQLRTDAQDGRVSALEYALASAMSGSRLLVRKITPDFERG